MKTSELTGAALDWAVAKCEGAEIVELKHGRATFIDPSDDGALNEMFINYSTDWAQGGPIIEREYISVLPWLVGGWKARTTANDGAEYVCEGPTPLVAAMRCYVASMMGVEVEVPEELGVLA